MGGIGADVGKEGGLCLLLFANPAEGCLEEDIGTEALGLYDRVVVQGRYVKVAGLPVAVGGEVSAAAGIGLADASGSMDEHLAEVEVVAVAAPRAPLDC